MIMFYKSNFDLFTNVLLSTNSSLGVTYTFKYYKRSGHPQYKHTKFFSRASLLLRHHRNSMQARSYPKPCPDPTYWDLTSYWRCVWLCIFPSVVCSKTDYLFGYWNMENMFSLIWMPLWINASYTWLLYCRRGPTKCVGKKVCFRQPFWFEVYIFKFH